MADLTPETTIRVLNAAEVNRAMELEAAKVREAMRRMRESVFETIVSPGLELGSSQETSRAESPSLQSPSPMDEDESFCGPPRVKFIEIESAVVEPISEGFNQVLLIGGKTLRQIDEGDFDDWAEVTHSNKDSKHCVRIIVPGHLLRDTLATLEDLCADFTRKCKIESPKLPMFQESDACRDVADDDEVMADEEDCKT